MRHVVEIEKNLIVDIQKRFHHLDLIQEAVLILNGARQVIFGNQSAASRFGRLQTGQDIVHIIRNPLCVNMVNEAISGAKTAQKTIVFGEPADGTFDVRVSRFTDAAIGGDLVLVSLRDINELVQAEAIRSDFVANVSHELRSPLSTLTGFIETLQGPAKNDPPAQARFLGMMGEEADRMVRLIADLLTLSKVEANQRLRPVARVDVAALAGRVLTLLENKAADQGKSIRLIVPHPIDDIPGNDDQLVQILQNLLENALKYSADKSVVTVAITAEMSVSGIEGPVVAIRVQDQSEGIAPQHIPRLTERFYRIDSHRSRNDGGTGLGLAIVKHIVLRHRGRLKIESVSGEGSTFTVFLPVSA